MVLHTSAYKRGKSLSPECLDTAARVVLHTSACYKKGEISLAGIYVIKRGGGGRISLAGVKKHSGKRGFIYLKKGGGNSLA